ncbi:MAG: small multi-drug export protein [Clostridia bacterium]|nr:small multi-drug export protein [Clostridia bacterium]
MDSVVNSIIAALSARNVSPQIITLLISMIPLLELRGSILIAGAALKLPLIQTYITAVIGNMLPIPFILLFIEKIFNSMKKVKYLEKFPNWCEKKAMKKADQIKKYGYWGLFLFVAIPLPGTGAWTGSLLAVLLGLKRGKSLLFILLGVMTAGLIMSLISYGVLQSIINLFH